MAPALSQVCGHGMLESRDGLQMLPLLQLMLCVETHRTVCMMVQEVCNMLGRARCWFRHIGRQEADPTGCSANPDWKMFQTGFRTSGSL